MGNRAYFLVAFLIIALSALTLLLMGRIPICECGYVKLWHGVVQSSENSQHISDWYTPSHIIHGFGFFYLLWRFAKKWSFGARFVAATFAESFWEVFENTDMIINRYRSVTISLDYFGDSVINSMGDILAMVVGFFLAARLPVWVTIASTIALELLVGYFIRDNLTLNIIMLIYPFRAILNWQQG